MHNLKNTACRFAHEPANMERQTFFFCNCQCGVPRKNWRTFKSTPIDHILMYGGRISIFEYFRAE